MRPYLVKEKLLALLEKNISGEPYFSLENYALSVLKRKLSDNTLSESECLLLVEEFLAGHLEFDENGKPANDTLFIEEMIDFMLATTRFSKE